MRNLARQDGHLRVLLLCEHYFIPYRVLRCFVASGASVFVLGGTQSKGLRYSRYCTQFLSAKDVLGDQPIAKSAITLNAIIARLRIDIVAAGDSPSTKALIQLCDKLTAPTFPMPTESQFDLLNDKREFVKLCSDLGIPHPDSRIFDSMESLLISIEHEEVTFPAIAKPLSSEGGRGVVVLPSKDAKIDDLKYQPILVQQYIEGEDIGASIYCVNGLIQALVLHRFARAMYSTFFREDIVTSLHRIAEKLELNGVFNFDMRLATNGDVFFLECNPRFFYRIYLSMIAGINFASCGLPNQRRDHCQKTLDGASVREPKAIIAALITPWRLTSRDLALVRFFFSDPVITMRELFGLNRDPRSI